MYSAGLRSGNSDSHRSGSAVQPRLSGHCAGRLSLFHRTGARRLGSAWLSPGAETWDVGPRHSDGEWLELWLGTTEIQCPHPVTVQGTQDGVVTATHKSPTESRM